jgi:hypothetical protein
MRDLSNFWSLVEKTPTCWIWLGGKSKEGYGYFYFGQAYEPNRRPITGAAHRLAYKLSRGPIPAGMHIDHLCRNPACVNPDHLEAVTCRENIMRGIGPTAANARKTHCPLGHEYSPTNTKVNKSGARTCIACKRLRNETKYWRTTTHDARR